VERMDTSLHRFKFQRAQRIRSSADFERIFNRRCTAHSSAMGLYVDANGLGLARLGIRIGRRAGTAALRVRSRRRVREAFRRMQHQLPAMDYIVVIRSTAMTSSDYEAMLTDLAGRAYRKFERTKPSGA
jgi:ribonuclease P protein component